MVGNDTIKIFFEFDIGNFEKNKDYNLFHIHNKYQLIK